jgi:hypothetical protein
VLAAAGWDTDNFVMRIEVTICVGNKEKIFICDLADLSDAIAEQLLLLGYPEKPLTGIRIKT